MASGYGLNGGPSRCFPFWQEVLACYSANVSAENPLAMRKCSFVLEDYYECLHHKKEYVRASVIQDAYRQREKTYDRSNDPTADQIRKLGVLEGPPEEKNLKPNRFLPHLKTN